jgi:hypothetical protein
MSIKLAHTALNIAIEILGDKYGSNESKLEVLAIGGQETKFTARRQIIKKDGKLVPSGPATSFWQFEQGGGVAGVLRHESSATLAKRLCAVRDVAPTSAAVWAAMEHDDVLGAGFARLLLLTDIGKLPKIGDAEAGWATYIKNWRPGKPHKDTWATAYANARTELGV